MPVYKDGDCFAAFREFDVDGRGFINLTELTSGLIDMQISPDQSSVYAFFKLFDNDKDKKLRFSDFSKAFLPIDKSQQSDLLIREPKNLKRDRALKSCFQQSTWI